MGRGRRRALRPGCTPARCEEHQGKPSRAARRTSGVSSVYLHSVRTWTELSDTGRKRRAGAPPFVRERMTAPKGRVRKWTWKSSRNEDHVPLEP